MRLFKISVTFANTFLQKIRWDLSSQYRSFRVKSLRSLGATSSLKSTMAFRTGPDKSSSSFSFTTFALTGSRSWFWSGASPWPWRGSAASWGCSAQSSSSTLWCSFPSGGMKWTNLFRKSFWRSILRPPHFLNSAYVFACLYFCTFQISRQLHFPSFWCPSCQTRVPNCPLAQQSAGHLCWPWQTHEVVEIRPKKTTLMIQICVHLGDTKSQLLMATIICIHGDVLLLHWMAVAGHLFAKFIIIQIYNMVTGRCCPSTWAWNGQWIHRKVRQAQSTVVSMLIIKTKLGFIWRRPAHIRCKMKFPPEKCPTNPMGFHDPAHEIQPGRIQTKNLHKKAKDELPARLCHSSHINAFLRGNHSGHGSSHGTINHWCHSLHGPSPFYIPCMMPCSLLHT